MIDCSPFGNWPLLPSAMENCDLSLTRDGAFHLSWRGIRVKVDEGSREKLAVCMFSRDRPVDGTKVGCLVRCNPTYGGCPAAVSSSSGTSPGLLTWLLCNYSWHAASDHRCWAPCRSKRAVLGEAHAWVWETQALFSLKNTYWTIRMKTYKSGNMSPCYK